MEMTNAKSLQIFDDMKSGLYDRGYTEDQLIIAPEDPLRYELQIKTSFDESDSRATLWACYLPESRLVYAGVTFPERIPMTKIPVTLDLINMINGASWMQHMSLCPTCHRIDAITGIVLTRGKLPKEKFQIMLSVSEANATVDHPLIRQIAGDDYSVERLVSTICENNPEFGKHLGGKL